MKVKVNDNVIVAAGKDTGKTGKVLKTITGGKTERVVVENVNVATKHQKPRSEQAGMIVKQEASLDASNVLVICPECQKATRIAHTIVDGRKLRQCKKCQKTFK